MAVSSHERYRVVYPTLVTFDDATYGLIKPDTLITLNGPEFNEGRAVKVIWDGNQGTVHTQDLRVRAMLEPEA